MSVKFYLPEFYYKYELNITIIKMIMDYPEWFRDDLEIGAIYGTFPGAIWNGGRVFLGSADANNIEETIKGFNDLGVPLRFTFTNCLLEEKHTYDTYCNVIMEKANSGINEVLTNSMCLEEYLRAQYPNFKYIMSTTRCERSLDKINAACSRYDLVVPDYRDNLDQKFLESLEQKNKIELLINPYCIPDCPRRSEHYRYLSESQLNYGVQSDFSCPDELASFYDVMNRYPTVLKTEQIDQLIEMGFSNFKIEGRRNHNADVIESYVYYMVKPEFRDRVRLMLTKAVWR